MGIFSWGCARFSGEPPELPCEICGVEVGNCECPECPECGAVGNPGCYEQHGMVRTERQIELRRQFEEQQERDRLSDVPGVYTDESEE